jgi:hypothetical protein
MLHRIISIIIIGFASVSGLFAQSAGKPDQSSPVKVACIGNSITYGSGIQELVIIPLDSRNYHTFRSKFHNAQLVFEREKKGRVVFLGGSITAGGGWRDSLYADLHKRFSETQLNSSMQGYPLWEAPPELFALNAMCYARGRLIFYLSTQQ